MTKFCKLILVLAIFLASCERVIDMRGYVYDSATKLPIDSVKICMILGRADTVKFYTEHDSVSYDCRIELGKQGVKDDFRGHDAIGYVKDVTSYSYTNNTGYFSIGSGIIGCVPGCPEGHILLVKPGYKPLFVPIDSVKADSVLLVRVY